MAGSKVLVLGGTGPAGICVVRELLHRKIGTIVFCRNPSKVPEDLAPNALLEVVKGDSSAHNALSRAVAQSRAIISLLGPSSVAQPRNAFADWYRTIVPLMQKHGLSRLFALGTNAIRRADDQTSVSRALMNGLIRIIANSGFQNMLAVQEYFESIDHLEVDWTVFRLGMLSGTSDAAAWSVDREKGKAYAGPVAGAGYTGGINRSVLARWVVDEALTEESRWSHQMPAVTNRG
ncbi:hypothetical protein ACKLNR_015270 [Fusarium oxysporum f. sp. zingiberi]|uniref:NAD(P)-binding domain-containing protein n=1 Tax=Fusarium oxysporum f. sp. vasinfectum 25433 TaxID=1089449 RepID=X0KLR9_FUSOX|nr:hypothetical protein FOTG_17052 [Fusarium oxysporum f. sp. vasinfectum 25433]KAK2675115.1 hypothetical protein RAB80_010099 [Fusarium oxysporum f. sp. vasinfectum]KAK2686838.1 hypothetical protein QWA68_014724 [Fusarium oxysporum]KAK2931544.1 hypothetical protein FoTM2_009056 [Fusarium oxysporum f. sp. vasinfectum]